jgi:arylsulfatase A-like enzyme
VGLAVALLATAALVSCAEPVARRPNVLLIVVDTLRADHLSSYGYPHETSPHLDALAARGAVFMDCTAQASWTVSSMMSLMTGLPIFQTIYRIPDEYPVLAEHYARAGYRTGAFVANSVLSEETGFQRGFESWDVRALKTRQWIADDVNRRAVRFLIEEDERPFFLWLHYLDPHYPYEPPQEPTLRPVDEVFTDFEREGIEAAIEAAPVAERATLAAQVEALAADVDRYDGELRFVDERIGRVLDMLERRGLLDDTVVVVASDHGETLFRRPVHPTRLSTMRAWHARWGTTMGLADYVKREHASWTTEELVRTPLIIAGPGVAPGQRVDALVANLDLLPTLLGLCGLEAPGDLPGRDLSAVLGRAGRVPPAAWATSTGDVEVSVKLPDGRKLTVPSAEMEELFGLATALYDLEEDPYELSPRPLDARAEELLSRLREAIADDPFRSFQGADVDPETLERLRELGYIR